MSRLALLLVLFSLVLLPTHVIFAQGRTVCKNDPCTRGDVGAFMEGIAKKCGDAGDCSIEDITKVFANVGNWILGIIGALVFLMYIWGGINILVGGASAERLAAGKKAIKTATIGLVIVFVAFAAITTLKNNILGGASYGGPSGACTINSQVGQPCGERKACNAAHQCVDSCRVKFTDRRCVPATNARVVYPGAQCDADLCSDPDVNIQCCQVPQAILDANP